MTLQHAIPHSFADVRRLLRKHIWRLVLPCFAVPLIVLTAALFVPRQYEAEALFERRNDIVMTEIAGRGAPQSFSRMKQGLSSELAGGPAVARVIDDLKLVTPLSPGAGPAERQRYEIAKQDLLQHIQRDTRVIFEVNSNEVDRVRLVFNDSDPVRARLVVNRLVENYFSSARSQIDGMLTQAAAFFEKQLNASRDEIDSLEHRKLTFEIEKRDLLPTETGGFARSLPDAEDHLAIATQNYTSAQKRMESLAAEAAELAGDTTPTIVKKVNPEIAIVAERIREYQKKVEQCTVIQKMTDKHPTVVSLRKQIAELTEQLKRLPEEVVSERVFAESNRKTQVQLALLDARAQAEKAGEELKTATLQVNRLKMQTEQFFPVRAEYRKLERLIDDSQRHMKFWEENLQRIRVALAAELGDRGINLSFLKPCDPIQRPSSPSFAQIVAIAILLSLAVGCVWTVLAEQADNRYDITRDADRPLGLPVLGSVSAIMPPGSRWRQRLLKILGYPTAGAAMSVLLLSIAYMNYTTLRTPRNIQAELTITDPDGHPDRAVQRLASPETTGGGN